MPALDNPRWERFAQAIVEGLANGDRKPYSQGRAYIAAGYTAKDQGKRGGSAECAASRLLNRVSITVRGTFNESADYRRLDVVALNGGGFVALKDAPGHCPGSGWQLLASQGKRAVLPARRGKRGPPGPKGDAGARGATIHDWKIDRARYVATPLMSDGPEGPPLELRGLLLRRRAEAALWKERLDPQTVRAYFDKDQPLTAQGKFALARALLLEGDRTDAQNFVREAWHYHNFSGDLEVKILDVFRGLITDADHKTRMDMRLYAEDVEGAMRSATRTSGNAPVIAKARVAD